MRRFSLMLLAAACGMLSHAVYAHAASGFTGEFDLQSAYTGNTGNSLDAALGERNHWDQDGWLRLMWTGKLGRGWNLDAAYLGEVRYGGGVALTRREYQSDPGFFVKLNRMELLPLNDTLTNGGRLDVTQRLDRLAFAYSSPHLALRIGRQALTWGGGLVFHPMDLFDPFAPNAIYTAYKPGADMVYGQWLFKSGADIQAVIVPRRDPRTRAVSTDQFSEGVKWHGFLGRNQRFGMDLMLAQDHRSQVVGVGLSGPLGGAAWTAEIIPAHEDGGGVKTSLLMNLKYAWSWGSRNVTSYIEYFHNGYGVGGSDHTLTDLPEGLIKRLARGELFTVSEDYLSPGIELQWTPLLTLKPSVVANLDDGSVMLLGQAVYSLSQNTSLTAGFQWAVGRRGTEYGGLETSPNSGIFASPGNDVYIRLTRYFQVR